MKSSIFSLNFMFFPFYDIIEHCDFQQDQISHLNIYMYFNFFFLQLIKISYQQHSCNSVVDLSVQRSDIISATWKSLSSFTQSMIVSHHSLVCIDQNQFLLIPVCFTSTLGSAEKIWYFNRKNRGIKTDKVNTSQGIQF